MLNYIEWTTFTSKKTKFLAVETRNDENGKKGFQIYDRDMSRYGNYQSIKSFKRLFNLYGKEKLKKISHG